MSDTPTLPGKNALLSFDGKIPLWGIVLIGVSFAVWSWNEFRDLQNRMMVQELNAAEHRKKTDTLETQQQNTAILMAKVNTQLEVMKELMIRVEKRLDPPR